MSKLVTMVALSTIVLGPGQEDAVAGKPFSVDESEAPRLKALGVAREPELDAPESIDARKVKAANKAREEAEAKVEFLTDANDELQSQVAGLQSSLAAAESRAKSAESNLSAAQTQLAAANATVADLQKKLAAVPKT